ncbi:MAG: hypothetical protein WAK94_03120 [Steroidobacteraceae bacterium]
MLRSKSLRERLRRYPLLAAAYLEGANRLRSWRAQTRLARSWFAAGALLGVAGAGIAAAVAATVSLVALKSHLMTVGILVALQASMLAHWGRRKWTAIYSSNWLSTLPTTRRATLTAVAWRSFLWPLLAWLVLTSAVLLSSRTVTGLSGLTVPLFAAISVATVIGALLGWFLPYRNTDDMRLVTPHSLGSGPSGTPTLAGLSSWAAVQTRVWLRPRSLARLLLPAMLALPMDMSGNVAVALLFVSAVALYLLVLLRAMAHVARAGAAWLRPTPLTFRRFAWAVARHPLLKQAQWTLVAAGFLIALGCKPLLAVRVAEAWLALVGVTSGIALAHAYQSRSFRLKLLISICALAVVERLREHLVLPCALLIAGWQLRRVART